MVVICAFFYRHQYSGIVDAFWAWSEGASSAKDFDCAPWIRKGLLLKHCLNIITQCSPGLH